MSFARTSVRQGCCPARCGGHDLDLAISLIHLRVDDRRGNPARIRVAGLLKPGQEVTAFGGDAVSPMTMTFAVEEFLQAGSEKEIYESIDMPPNKKDDGLAAVLAEVTVGGVTKEVWLQKSPTFDPSYKSVTFADSKRRVEKKNVRRVGMREEEKTIEERQKE